MTKATDVEVFERVGCVWISPLKVLQDENGYYIGRTYLDSTDNAELPFSQESEYFANEYIAQTALDGEYHDEAQKV